MNEFLAVLMWLSGQTPPPQEPPLDPGVTLNGGGIPTQPPEKQ